MQKELLHIYGPFSIYSYGLMIAIGLVVIIRLAQRHTTFKRLQLDRHFASIMIVSILAGIFGGRLLYTLSESDGPRTLLDFLAYWQGGFSILGSIIAISIVLPLWLRCCNIPVIPFLDFAAIHAPLLQGIARIGCLCAGCCYGLPSSLPWAIIYRDFDSAAPLHVYLHPTQLYSSLLLLLIFGLLYFILQYRFTKPGQMFSLYLLGASVERFVVDFWRADRVFTTQPYLTNISIYQWIALVIMLSATLLFYFFTYKYKQQR